MKSFSAAMLIIGTVIGAGFASGREIVSFFGADVSPFAAFACGALIFLLSAVFLFLGSRLRLNNISAVNRRLAGGAHAVIDIFLLFNNFIVLSGMLAGTDSLFRPMLNIAPFYSIAAGSLCVFIVCRGVKGLLDCNRIVVPLIIAALAALCLFADKTAAAPPRPFVFGTAGVALVYVAMNMMLAGTVLTTVSGLSKGNILWGSGIASAVMTLLIFLLILAINASPAASADMPVLEIARALGPFAYRLITAVIAVSIFTTMLTAMNGLTDWFYTLFASRLYASVLVLLTALSLSNLGFANVVTYLYPIIGVLGVVYVALAVLCALRIIAPRARLFRVRKLRAGAGGFKAADFLDRN
ncbi:MAG: hypothetical protein LBP26_07020 [Clostridiales bacterium]|jgi:uncharacterized membrane protein YkvI|nr:hypothetical protein [Clostridiales bacterium]